MWKNSHGRHGLGNIQQNPSFPVCLNKLSALFFTTPFSGFWRKNLMDSCLVFQNRLCRLWVQYNLHAPAGRRSFSSSALNLKHFRINLNINEYQDMMIWSHLQVSQTRKVWLFVSQQFTGAESEVCCPPLDRAGNKPLRRFHNPAFFWLKASTTAFTFKNLC